MCVSQENGKGIDLNVEMQLTDGIVEDMEDTVVRWKCKQLKRDLVEA